MDTLTDLDRTLACFVILLALALTLPMAISHADRWLCAVRSKR